MSRLGILKQWFDTVWMRGDMEAVDGFFAPEVAAYGIIDGLKARPEDFKAMIPALRALTRDARFRVLRHIECGDWLWVLVGITARSAATLEPMEFSGQLAIRFEGDKFAEAYNHFDFVSFAEQIGAMPPDTVLLCMSGERLTL